MKLIPILLSDFGLFNLHPELLSKIVVPLNSIFLRTDPNLINLYNLNGNKILQNCYVRKENIPEEILQKNIIIQADCLGKETLDVYENNGDVVMKYW
jgi:hypothetical protein